MKLAEYLINSNLSQYKFAQLIKVNQKTISQYIRGKRMPRAEVMKKIHEVTKGAVSFADWYVESDYERLKLDIKSFNISLEELNKWLGRKYSRQTIKNKLQNAKFTTIEFRCLRIRLDKLLANMNIDHNYDAQLMYVKDIKSTYKIPGKILQHVIGISQASISQRFNKDIKFTSTQISTLYKFMQACEQAKGKDIYKLADKFSITQEA